MDVTLQDAASHSLTASLESQGMHYLQSWQQLHAQHTLVFESTALVPLPHVWIAADHYGHSFCRISGS